MNIGRTIQRQSNNKAIVYILLSLVVYIFKQFDIYDNSVKTTVAFNQCTEEQRLLLTFLMSVQGCVIFIAFLKRIKNLEKLKNFSIHEYCF